MTRDDLTKLCMGVPGVSVVHIREDFGAHTAYVEIEILTGYCGLTDMILNDIRALIEPVRPVAISIKVSERRVKHGPYR